MSCGVVEQRRWVPGALATAVSFCLAWPSAGAGSRETALGLAADRSGAKDRGCDSAELSEERLGSLDSGEPRLAEADRDCGQGRAKKFEDSWRFADWYHNEENPIVQSVRFSGRMQIDYALVSADQGDHDEWNVRRFRLGAKVKLVRKLTIHGEVDLNPHERDPVYQRITDLYAQWRVSEHAEITVGKHGVPFTLDGSTSSKELLAIDRSNLSNNLWFPEEYIPGVSVAGKRGAWSYRTGVFSSGRANGEFGHFDGGTFTLWSVGHDFARRLGTKKAELTGSFVAQRADENNTFTRRLERVLSTNFNLEQGRWGVRADLTAGRGYLGQSDLRGAMAMPFFSITDDLQLVGRYTYVTSDEANGVRLARYENELVAGRGDRYTELYLGLNYYLYGHRLKAQAGVQFAELADRAKDGGEYSGVALTIGMRMSW